MKVRLFHGMCDASAAAYLGDGHFVMADDESNALRTYSLEEGKKLPVGELDLQAFLQMGAKKQRESDIEGCTQIGDTLYWISSHGRNKDGKWRPMRYRFFATKMVPSEGGKFTLKPEGEPFTGLVLGLLHLKEPSLLPYIGVAGKKDNTGNLAPKKQGLNIESMCASEDGKIIYIGFRNPRPGGRAMLLPLHNPAELIQAGEREPRFGKPIYFDFGGLGIRAMEYSPFHRDHIIIAGSHDNKRSSQLYRWSGEVGEKARRIRELGDFNPETVLVNPASSVLRFFSDDGSVLYKVPQNQSLAKLEDGRCECKDLADPKMRAFRMVELDLAR
ncbi:MAG: hypothetical protein ACI8XO_000933 [Verrucomicrobiales bacterium]|jgi:hypothetical protein